MLAKSGMDKKGDAERLRLLFVNIITQAVKDAFLKLYTTKSAEGISICAKNNAIFWLTEDRQDFYEICDYAGVSADRIRKKAKELMEMPERERIAEVRKMIRKFRELDSKFPIYGISK